MNQHETKISRDLLEDMLKFIAIYGRVRLIEMNSGWWCRVDMRVSRLGVEFAVMSDPGHKTPVTAVIECRDRMEAAMRDLKEGGKS